MADIVTISNEKLERLKRVGAIVDGAIEDPQEMARLEEELLQSPEDAELLGELRQQKNDLKRLVYAEALRQSHRRAAIPTMRLAAIAAGIILVLSAGALAGVYGTNRYLSSDTVAAQQFAQEAVVSYQVLTAANDLPVRLAPGQLDELAPILNEYFGADVSIPRQVGQDYFLKNVGIFSDESGPAIQVSYENPAGRRIAFRIGVAEQGLASEKFEWQVHGELRTCLWRSSKAKFALTGPFSREEMLDLAKSITILGIGQQSAS